MPKHSKHQKGGKAQSNQENGRSRTPSQARGSAKAKTKPIRKEGAKQKQMPTPVKGKVHKLFNIVPLNDDDEEDQFAALGDVSQSQEQIIESQKDNLEDQQQQQQYDQDEQMGEDAEQQQEQQQEQQEQEQGNLEHEQNGQLQNGQEKQEENDGEVDCDMPPKQQEENKQHVDISVINMQIQQTLQILMNIHRLGNGLPRQHYVDRLKQYLHQYYGYNFQLIDHFIDMFNPNQLVQFFQANQTQRPLTIRTNTLKTRRKQLAQNLIQRGVNLDPLAEWSKVGIKIYQTKVPIGATPQYLAGHYMLQSASSLLPVLALDPQLNDRVLDMAAAPGGKTTYIAQLMKNTGCIFANDLKKERLRALQFNLYRMGISNTTITCRDGRKYPQLYPNSFDKVLLDAPCTGLGIISKDYSIKANRVLVDIYKNSHVQKELLLAAIDCAKVNGVVVYSTCSVSPLQNEEVVNYVLKKRHVKLVQCGIEVGQEGMLKFGEKRFHQDLKKTRRIYPHVHNMDGFYVAKLVKVGKGKKIVEGEKQEQEQEQIEPVQMVEEQIKTKKTKK